MLREIGTKMRSPAFAPGKSGAHDGGRGEGRMLAAASRQRFELLQPGCQFRTIPDYAGAGREDGAHWRQIGSRRQGQRQGRGAGVDDGV